MSAVIESVSRGMPAALKEVRGLGFTFKRRAAGRACLLRPARDATARPRRSTDAWIGARIPEPDERHRTIATRVRRIQGTTTPSFRMSLKACGTSDSGTSGDNKSRTSMSNGDRSATRPVSHVKRSQHRNSPFIRPGGCLRIIRKGTMLFVQGHVGVILRQHLATAFRSLCENGDHLGRR